MEEMIVTMAHEEKRLETTKLILSDAKAALEPIAAKLALEIEGGNAETRKASLTLARQASKEYQMHETAVRAAETDIIDAQDALSAVTKRYAVMRLRVAHKTAQLQFLSGGN